MPRISVQMTVSLPPALYKQAMLLAKRESRSKSELVREALRDYITRRGMVLEARKRLADNLRKSGTRKLKDIERMIDEGRS